MTLHPRVASIGVTALLLLCSAPRVQAALIAANYPIFNFLGAPQDGKNVTTDTATGLQWLDWSLTTNRSYNDVFAQTQGGNLDGWRYATEDEF